MRIAVVAAISFCLVGLAVAAESQAAMTKLPTNIPAQGLGAALKELARDRGFQVVFRSEVVGSTRTQGASGNLTMPEALTELLKGTNLAYSYLDENTVTIVPAAPASGSVAADQSPASPQINSGRDGTTSQEFRVAQVDQTPAGPPVASSDDQNSENKRKEEKDQGIPEILVKGSRILNVDIKRTEDDVQPYTIFDSQQIQQSGAANLEDFLKQQLTMNTVSQTNSQDYASPLGNTSTINLRGLGANETLVLIDGRRSASVTLYGSGSQPDINGIPISAIERIEVLPSSASAIYGGAALGGVVNIIVKKRYDGGDLSYTYENVTSGHAPLRTVTGSYGLTLEGGKTMVMISGQYSDGSPLLTQDRIGLVGRGYADILKNNPAFFTSSPAAPIVGASTNIGSADGVSNLTLKSNGASLNSPIATIAPGTSSLTPSSIIPGQWNNSLSEFAQANGPVLGSVPRTKSLMANLRREFTPSLEIFGEFSTASNIGVSSFAPINTTGGLFVPASSPANPFNQDVNVAFPNSLVTPWLTDSVTQSSTVGALWRLPATWNAEIDYTWSRNAVELSHDNYDYDALPADLASGALDPFVDTLAHPLQLARYLAPATYSAGSTLNDLGLRVSGPIGSLPWGGEPRLTIGLEHRKEGTHNGNSYYTYPLTPSIDEHDIFFGQFQTTNSIYAEAQTPLVLPQKAGVPRILWRLILTPFSCSFKFIWAYASDVAVATPTVVEGFDVAVNIQSCQLTSIVYPLLDSFLLQAGEEGLCNRVVPTVSPATHTGFKAVLPTEPPPVVTAELNSLIRVNDCSLWPASLYRHHRGIQGQFAMYG